MRKLTLNDAIRIRVEVKHGATPEHMAERFRISLTQVQAILARRTHSVASITDKIRKRQNRNRGAKIGEIE